MIPLCKGKKRSIVWGADSLGRYRGKEYFDKLDIGDQAKFVPLFNHLSNELRIHNDTRFKKEIDGIYCFKSGRHRLACFFDDGQIVIISGFEKKTRRDRRSKTKLEVAVRLKDAYLKQKEN